MNNAEFSNELDVLINAFLNEASDGQENNKLDFKVDEYEKSVFLTKAQDEFVKRCYEGKTAEFPGFEAEEEFRRYLSELVITKVLEPIDGIETDKLSVSSKFFKLPDDLWYITYEACRYKLPEPCKEEIEIDVIPSTQDEFHRTKRNPFRGPNRSRALRLDITDNTVEIVPIATINISKYILRYLKEPEPIILEDLEDLSINGFSEYNECKLPSSCHEYILDLAFRMIVSSKSLGRAVEK